MIKIIAAIALIATIYICATVAEKREMKNTPVYSYVSVDTSVLKYKQQAYIPVNAPMHSIQNRKVVKMVLKVRNTSFSDSIYLSRIDYYDTQGLLINKFLDSFWLVRPMSTSVILVNNNDSKKSIDNFIVEWHSNAQVQPLLQVFGLNQQNRTLSTDNGIFIEN